VSDDGKVTYENGEPVEYDGIDLTTLAAELLDMIEDDDLNLASQEHWDKVVEDHTDPVTVEMTQNLDKSDQALLLLHSRNRARFALAMHKARMAAAR